MTSDPEFSDFEAVRTRPSDELRALLHRGDPIERAWAGWALALQIGAAANPELIAAAYASPTPGVRSLLLVVLASHGERDLLETFAQDDPDDDVRAAACRYIALAHPIHDPGASDFLAERLRNDDSWRVRAEILRLLRDDRIVLPRSLIEAFAADEALDVRSLVAELLLSAFLPTGSFPSALEPRVVAETDQDLRRRLTQAWITVGGGRALLDWVALNPSTDPTVAAELMEALARASKRFEWSRLKPIADRQSELLDAQVVCLLHRNSVRAAWSWLLEVWARPLDSVQAANDRETARRDRRAYEAARTAERHLRRACGEVVRDDLSDFDLAAITRLTEQIERDREVGREFWLEDEGIDVTKLPIRDQPHFYVIDGLFLERIRALLPMSDRDRQNRRTP